MLRAIQHYNRNIIQLLMGGGSTQVIIAPQNGLYNLVHVLFRLILHCSTLTVKGLEAVLWTVISYNLSLNSVLPKYWGYRSQRLYFEWFLVPESLIFGYLDNPLRVQPPQINGMYSKVPELQSQIPRPKVLRPSRQSPRWSGEGA